MYRYTSITSRNIHGSDQQFARLYRHAPQSNNQPFQHVPPILSIPYVNIDQGEVNGMNIHL